MFTRIAICCVALSACSLFACNANAQRFLDQLEGVLDAEAAAEEARKAASEPKLVERPRPGYLGFVAIEVDDRIVIETVRRATAAERAGVQAGDFITQVDGRPVETLDELGAALRGRVVGDRVALSVKRDRRDMVLVATLGERPAPAIDVDDVPPEPDPFAPDIVREPPKPKADPPVDALDALRTLEALLDEEAAAPPGPKVDPARERRIAEYERELDAIKRRIRELEREIGGLDAKRD